MSIERSTSLDQQITRQETVRLGNQVTVLQQIDHATLVWIVVAIIVAVVHIGKDILTNGIVAEYPRLEGTAIQLTGGTRCADIQHTRIGQEVNVGIIVDEFHQVGSGSREQHWVAGRTTVDVERVLGQLVVEVRILQLVVIGRERVLVGGMTCVVVD